MAVLVSEPFGKLRATLLGVQSLCVPASVTTGGALAAPPTGLDDFACYSVGAQTASARPLSVGDRFGVSDDRIGRVVSVCAPASVESDASASVCAISWLMYRLPDATASTASTSTRGALAFVM